MDWFSWLSKTGLESSLVYEYGLSFSQNELEHEDISFLNHEFLQSMGISIAKHRLEILKLARKGRGLSSSSSSSNGMGGRVIVAIKRTKRCLSKYIRTLVNAAGMKDDDESALVVVPNRRPPPGYGKWRGSLLMKRSNKLLMGQQNRFLLTNGTPLMVSAAPRLDCFSSPVIYDLHNKLEDHHQKVEDEDYWANGVEEIRVDQLERKVEGGTKKRAYLWDEGSV